ncbi:MAG: hypothetical protein Q4A65_06385 [Bacillota bacterium]|nr:hypothetical protein [Bacillota bacterium]
MRFIRDHKFISSCVVIAIILVAVVLHGAFATTEEDIAAGEDAIRQTIQDRALQCYVIESAYPESLSYLEDNYGLTVNKEDYLIVYNSYADNQPPQVKVIYQGDKQ